MARVVGRVGGVRRAAVEGDGDRQGRRRGEEVVLVRRQALPGPVGIGRRPVDDAPRARARVSLGRGKLVGR